MKLTRSSRLSSGIMLLAISLSVAMPAEAQHHGGAPAGVPAGAPQFRQFQGGAAGVQNFPHPQAQPQFRQPQLQQSPQVQRDFDRRQNFAPVPGGFAVNQQRDYQRQQQLDRDQYRGRADVRVPFPDVPTRVGSPGWDRSGQFDRRFDGDRLRGDGRGQFDERRQYDGRRQIDGRGQYDGRGPIARAPYERPGFTGRPGVLPGQVGFEHRPPVYYRGNEPFNGRGVYDPFNHLRAGQGFYERNDPRFFDRQFGARWGNGWYGRTNGVWSNYRVRGRWPWYPAVGFGVGIGFYNGWGYNGINLGFGNSGYYAVDGFCPTEYIYLVTTGQYWRPDAGGPGWYGSDLPDTYNAPITVAVSEVVPVTDEDGEVVNYEKHVFYYNAFWDSSEQAYGYYDYNGDFHWVE